MMQKRNWKALLLWLLFSAGCVLMIFNTRFVADMSAFTPKKLSEKQQLLLDQLRDGTVARLVMLGIEGADSAQRATASRALGESLRKHPDFLFVQNGDAATQDKDKEYFFENRYLLSPAMDSKRFTAQGLHKALEDSIEALSGGMGMLFKQIFPRDPTGEMLQIFADTSPERQPLSQEGVWASRDGKRALLIVQIKASGIDIDAQGQALQIIRTDFAAIAKDKPQLKLVMSGTSVFAVASRNSIDAEVTKLAATSLLLVIALLLSVYRSPRLLFTGLLPVLTGALAGIASVSLAFGHVHALTLGFGTTLIGEAVDYSIYYYIQNAGGRKDGTKEGSFWKTVRLGVLTSISGFAVLLFSGFPGLSQLGLYSIAGLVSAALVTRYVLPGLLPADFSLPDLGRLARWVDLAISKLVRLRWVALIALLVSTVFLVSQSDHIWNRQLSALSPLSAAEQKLDAELRSGLGTDDMRYVATFSATDEQAALMGAEKMGAVLRQLTEEGAIGGFSSPAFALPSMATQKQRQDAIPDRAMLLANLKKAVAGQPVDASRLNGFIDDAQQQRSKPLLRRSDLEGTSTALLVDTLVIHRDDHWQVMLPLRSVNADNKDSADLDLQKISERLQSAAKAEGIEHMVVIDLLEETSGIFSNYLHEALKLSALGCIAVVILIGVSLRSASHTLRITVALGAAVVCEAALLLAGGTQLTIFHLIGFLLVVAVGSNYALFFAASDKTESLSDVKQTQLSVVVANMTTVCSFGVLGLSTLPVLKAMGSTVGLGAFMALAFSAMLVKSAHSVEKVE